MGSSSAGFARWRRDAAKEEAAAVQRIDWFIHESPECEHLINDAFRLGQRRMRRRCMRQLADEIGRHTALTVIARALAQALDRLQTRHWRTK